MAKEKVLNNEEVKDEEVVVEKVEGEVEPKETEAKKENGIMKVVKKVGAGAKKIAKHPLTKAAVVGVIGFVAGSMTSSKKSNDSNDEPMLLTQDYDFEEPKVTEAVTIEEF